MDKNNLKIGDSHQFLMPNSFPRFPQYRNNTCRDMEYKGFDIEFRTVEKGAFHCYIHFPGMLYKSGISPDKGRKILIRIDSESKEKNYAPKVTALNRYGVFRHIPAAPPEILLAQKMMTVLYRQPAKGRDLFDVSFLKGLTTPDFIYIEQCLGLDRNAFLKKFLDRIDVLDLNVLANDVEPFLFSADQKERVLSFRSLKIGDSH
jgi:hypothetical protein